MRVDRYNFPALVAKEYFQPLDELVTKDEEFRLSDYFESAIDEGRFKGGLYGLNVLFGAPSIYYNKDLLAKAGLEEPYALWKRGHRMEYVGGENYRRLLTVDPVFLKSLRITVTYALFAVPLGVAGSLALAVLLNQKVGGQRLFRT